MNHPTQPPQEIPAKKFKPRFDTSTLDGKIAVMQEAKRCGGVFYKLEDCWVFVHTPAFDQALSLYNFPAEPPPVRKCWVRFSVGAVAIGLQSTLHEPADKTGWIQVIDPASATPTAPIRNPENIDFNKYPIPPGYVVASEEDCENAKDCFGWMFFYDNEWILIDHGSREYIRKTWTYLRPFNWKP